MSRYRRLKIEGGAFFYTLALADRSNDLLVRHIERLRHTFPASHHSLTHLLPLAPHNILGDAHFDRQTSSANGAFGRQDRHDSAGVSAVTAAPRCQSSVRRSTSPVVRQAGQRARRNQ